jgi:hypothetical protein
VVRRATDSDGPARAALLAQVPMQAELALSVRRGADFDALYRLQSDTWECWVSECDGRLVGMGTVLVRDGYLGGEPARIGYLGDLRVAPSLGGFRLLSRLYGQVLREVADRHACDVFLTAVIESNARAVHSLTGERARRHGIPAYVPLCSFSIRSVHLVAPRRRRPTPFAVETAAEADVGELASFLDADARARPFGYALGEEGLRRRLARWPGLSLDRFYLAREPGGAIAGCVAVWDPRGVKRTVVEEYRGSMRRVRLGHDLLAAVVRGPKLPAPGGELRYAYATHQAVPSGDPAVLRALLEAVHADLRGRGLAFVSWWVPDGDSLSCAFGGFRYTDLRAGLYAVGAPGRELPRACLAPGRPGFEMALV